MLASSASWGCLKSRHNFTAFSGPPSPLLHIGAAVGTGRSHVGCRRHHGVAQSAAVAEPASAEGQQALKIATVSTLPQIQEVARLRAEAYYEEDRSRFVESFKKQFVAQEIESLQKRTAPGANGSPQAECLVALQPGADREVVGCIDIRLPFSHAAVQPAGVPVQDPQGAYILNVVVHEDYRGQGIGHALMVAAMQRAVQIWQASTLYTHVEATNEVAYRLYSRCGFMEHSSESKFGNATSLGRLVLLQVSAEQAAQVVRAACTMSYGYWLASTNGIGPSWLLARLKLGWEVHGWILLLTHSVHTQKEHIGAWQLTAYTR